MNDKNDLDLSPDDEFYDEALDESFEFDDDYDDLDLESGLGESDYDADDLDSDWDEEQSFESPVKKKSKFSLGFNAIVIIGALIFGVFIVFSQVKKEKLALENDGPTKVASVPTALRMEGSFTGPGSIQKQDDGSDASSAPKEFDNKLKESSNEKGFLFDDSILGDSKDIIGDIPPMPTPIASEQNGEIEQQENINDIKVNALEVVQESLKQEKEVLIDNPAPRSPDFVDVTSSEKEEVVQNTSLVLNAGVKEDVSKKVILEVSDQPISLDKKLDGIIQRLEGIENKISEIESKGVEQIKGINIDSLQQEVLPASLTKKEATAPEVKKVSKQTQIVKKSQPKKIVKLKRAVKWELRAAQPGKAWVSKKGQKDMRPVVIGDKLTGIGRIKSINHVNSRWVVQGSAGKIIQ